MANVMTILFAIFEEDVEVKASSQWTRGFALDGKYGKHHFALNFAIKSFEQLKSTP
jgi:hypothetical protein